MMDMRQFNSFDKTLKQKIKKGQKIKAQNKNK